MIEKKNKKRPRTCRLSLIKINSEDMKNIVAKSTEERECKEKTSCPSYVMFFVCDYKMLG